MENFISYSKLKYVGFFANAVFLLRSYVETLLHHTKGCKRSYLTGSMFFKDDGKDMDQADPWDDEKPNAGLVLRSNIMKGSKVACMMGVPHLDLFQSTRLLLDQVEVRLHLTRNKDSFCLMSAEQNPKYKIEITDISLNLLRIEPTEDTYLAHQELLLKGVKALYPIRRTVLVPLTLSTGTYSFNRPNVFGDGSLPEMVYIWQVSSEASHGSYTKNPFNLVHNNITNIACYANDEERPVRPLKLDFKKDDYAEAFALMNTFIMKTDSGNNISYSDYAKGNLVFVFDLTEDFSSLNWTKSPSSAGNLRIEAQFGSPLSSTQTVYVLGIFKNEILIDRYMKLILIIFKV